jgi:hypothetical protein
MNDLQKALESGSTEEIDFYLGDVSAKDFPQEVEDYVKSRLAEKEKEISILLEAISSLNEEIECGPECHSHVGEHCDCARLKRAYSVIRDIENKLKAYKD